MLVNIPEKTYDSHGLRNPEASGCSNQTWFAVFGKGKKTL